MTTILIADDHPIVLEGLLALLHASGYSVIACCRSGEEVLDKLQQTEPDIILLDLNMPVINGLEVARTLKLTERGQPHKIALLTASIDPAEIREAFHLGIDGLVLKESAARQLVQCLESVCAGNQWIDPEIVRVAVGSGNQPGFLSPQANSSLTPRELKVSQLVAHGFRNKEIGRQLDITEGTVKMYLHNIYDKLKIGSRVELSNFVRERRLL